MNSLGHLNCRWRLLLNLGLLFSHLFPGMAQLLPATAPTDNSSDSGVPAFALMINGNTNMKYGIDPLTDISGLKVKQSDLAAFKVNGSLISTSPSNVNSLLPNDIAYISCDKTAYPGNIDAARTISLANALDQPPVAIVLYSLFLSRCSLDPASGYHPYIYTMKDRNSSLDLSSRLNYTVRIGDSTIAFTPGGGSDNGSILGKTPTTAVAMIILYSITGIITALFLIIIVIGAIRAHRHPERYGPRNVLGLPRQSRARGIARAMLETIPIVKFGDNDPPKPAGVEPSNPGRDIEMAPQTGDVTDNNQPGSDPTSANTGPQTSHDSEGKGSDLVTTESATGAKSSSNSDAPADQGLACSVCTDDFSKGQDVRVLPCNHKFHPECIDPWLLNVSGTCPLCRIDLRPTSPAHDDEDGQSDLDSIMFNPPRHSRNSLTSFNADPTPSSRRSSRISFGHLLNRGRMRDATPEERIATLRHLRFVNRSDVDHQTNHPDQLEEAAEPSVAGNGELRTRNRLGARLSRVLGGGGGERSRPVSGAPSTREEHFLPSEPLATVQSVEEAPLHPSPPPSNH